MLASPFHFLIFFLHEESCTEPSPLQISFSRFQAFIRNKILNKARSFCHERKKITHVKNSLGYEFLFPLIQKMKVTEYQKCFELFDQSICSKAWNNKSQLKAQTSGWLQKFWSAPSNFWPEFFFLIKVRFLVEKSQLRPVNLCENLRIKCYLSLFNLNL